MYKGFSTIRTILIIALVASKGFAQNSHKVHPNIVDQVRDRQVTDCMIVFKNQMNLSVSPIDGNKEEKGRQVFEKLRNHASQSQQATIGLLEEATISYESFYIVNAIFAKADKNVIDKIMLLGEVESIRQTARHQLHLPPQESQSDQRRLEAIPWGLALIGADKVWELGYRGQGVVVGGQDTGVEWDHPALMERYRGWSAGKVDHNYHWYDAIKEISGLHKDLTISDNTNPCGLNLRVPCDDVNSSHGTHTMGTMVGYDAESDRIVGVAPAAKWIAARNMERGFGSPQTYLRGFQWFLAPTDLNGQNPDPALAPHVINNSWSCPTLEGCFLENFDLLEVAIDNLRAAGVVVVASAGNLGAQGCGTIQAPPAIFEGAFTVGSVDENDSISGFSSRGPVIIDGSMRPKPNVSAPGRSVLSSVRNGVYGYLSGTSMAGPHVAGVVALMISANPDLAGRVEDIESILEKSVVQKDVIDSCNQDDEIPAQNASHGFGRIDAYKAVQQAMQLTDLPSIPLISGVRVYPNPASVKVRIKLPQGVLPKRLSIYNALGQEVYSATQVSTNIMNSEVDIIVDHWPENMYYYFIRSNSGPFVGRFMVSKRRN